MRTRRAAEKEDIAHNGNATLIGVGRWFSRGRALANLGVCQLLSDRTSKNDMYCDN